MFGVVCDAVIPWILVMILSIGFPFGLDGSVLYTIYKLTILNVYSMIKTFSPYVSSRSRLRGVRTAIRSFLTPSRWALWQSINCFSRSDSSDHDLLT